MRSLAIIVAGAAALGGCSGSTTPYSVQSQMVLIDAAGTYYAGGAALPRTHLMFTQTRMPSIGGDPQYIDPTFTAVSGCVVNRYDAAGRPIPNTDLDAGAGFYTGYTKTLLAADARVPRPAGVYAAPIPDRLNCNKAMLKPYYECSFGDPNGLEKIAGEDPMSVWFPAVPQAIYTSMCAGCAACDAQMIPNGAGGMMTVCEQHPLTAGAVVTEDLSGGGGYSALTNQALPAIGGVAAFKIVRVTVGAADVAGIDAIKLDGTADVSLQWNCDPSPTNLAPGPAGCPPSGAATHLLSIYALSSTAGRDEFSPGTAYSVLQCFNPIDDPRATLTIAKEGIQTLLGNQAASVMMVVAQVDVVPASSLDHSVFLASGRGQFTLLSTGNALPGDMSAGVDGPGGGDDFGGTD